jgi:hypothetical protein
LRKACSRSRSVGRQQQVQQVSQQPPQVLAAAAGAGSAPASQAVVISKNAAFTIYPPYGIHFGLGPRPQWPGTTPHGQPTNPCLCVLRRARSLGPPCWKPWVAQLCLLLSATTLVGL